MTTIDDAPALFDMPAPVAPPSRPRGKNPPPQEPDAVATAQPSFDPSRWVMVGWRDARGAPPVTWQQLAAIFNATQGPCAGCGAQHHRYGDGGSPLCPTCRTALNPSPEHGRTLACTTNTASRPKT